MPYSIDNKAPLSPAEKPVMELLLEGRSRKVIAAYLHRSAHTIKAHTTNICRKLHARNVAHANSICWENDWVKTTKALLLVLLACNFSADEDARPIRKTRSTRKTETALEAGPAYTPEAYDAELLAWSMHTQLC